MKAFGGETVSAGSILVRQRGTRITPGTGVGLGKDHTLYAMRNGIVTFETHSHGKKRVKILPLKPNEPVQA